MDGAISAMNSLVRHNKLSALENWTKRDMLTGDQLKVDDTQLISLKHAQRLSGHEASARYKARGKVQTPFPNVEVGQIVFLYSDRSKLRGREKYLVTAVDEETVVVQKFTKNQFRSRQYTVKRSDLIIIPDEETSSKPKCPPKPIPTYLKIPNTEKHIPQNLHKKAPTPVYRGEIHTQEESSDDESDDEYGEDHIFRYFLPNKVNNAVPDEVGDDDGDRQAAVEGNAQIDNAVPDDNDGDSQVSDEEQIQEND